MQRLLAIIFGAALAALTLGVAIAGETVELVSVWNPTGALPDGCTPGLTGGGGPVKWVIIDSEPDGTRGVAETSADPTDYRFPLCIVDGRAFASLANVDVSVRFRPVAGKVDQAGGIAVRVKDARNYYVVRANALEDNVRLYAVVDGDRRQFAGKAVKVATNSGIRCACARSAITLPYSSTAPTCSRRPTSVSPSPAALPCGPRPTA